MLSKSNEVREGVLYSRPILIVRMLKNCIQMTRQCVNKKWWREDKWDSGFKIWFPLFFQLSCFYSNVTKEEKINKTKMNLTRTPLSPSRQTSMIWQAPRNKNLRHPAGKQLDSIDNEEQVMVSRRVPNSAGRVIDKPFELKKKFSKNKTYFYVLRKRCGMYRLTGAVNQLIYFFSSFPFTSCF